MGAALTGATACSPSGGTENSPETSSPTSSENSLASVDPCTVLSETELKSFGLKIPGKSKSTLPWTSGCSYKGDPVRLSLVTNTRETVASAEQKDTWATFERTTVHDRAAATAITKGSTQARICEVMFDAGNGMIQVQVSEPRLPDDVDECAEALKIAKKVEPKVPEPS
ncbi:DUF3558 domain-containing protein [Actinopolyspora mortivallis]|uniref:DUF3558 domain-containing protein n=1 Tax=Actinopolyspora mortivallis TaxID=33906 RepID=A0A2T0GSZ7_ACTMO|nr:DUF3558 domain-containing protein [Actinopolyspora mortivallis]PRW62163.1 DUF3558 domain-containing protein [Actinopolyspora mortivallis]